VIPKPCCDRRVDLARVRITDGLADSTVPSEVLRLVIFQELLDGSGGVADVAVAQSPGPERTGTVLAKRRQARQDMSDSVRHRRDLTACFCPCHGVAVAPPFPLMSALREQRHPLLRLDVSREEGPRKVAR
jgi:hypothetical protein